MRLNKSSSDESNCDADDAFCSIFGCDLLELTDVGSRKDDDWNE